MRRVLACFLVAAVVASMAGCIGVSATEQVSSNPRWQVAVVDYEIYLVDVKKKIARKVQIEGIEIAEDSSAEKPAMMSPVTERESEMVNPSRA